MGIVVGVCAGIAVTAAALAWFLIARRRRLRKTPSTSLVSSHKDYSLGAKVSDLHITMLPEIWPGVI